MNRNTVRRTSALILFSALLCACTSQRMFNDIRLAEKVFLYEGLPHPQGESELFERERRSVVPLAFAGYDFYENPLPLTEKQMLELNAAFGSPEVFQPVRKKLCGSFHPDYAVEWKRHGRVYQALVCFGCEEVKFLGKGIVLDRDFEDGEFKKIQGLLTQHRKYRPLPARARN